jgi:hypothetical protein
MGSPRTYCRVCRRPIRRPWWKAMIGLNSATCKDTVGCMARYHATGEASIRAERSAADRRASADYSRRD